ncbi:ABC transporter ATP-binding protein [Phytohabitans aurantiacus]|uniref:Multidrug ABC transporter permease n=1 Tax=Phytohabitans aurantiacus TaxID=3016789 RepID=A0ABQ5R513_9ACTN|nr:ABC transporter ATP-binding protein [Phytohabitans aurantiacus]GLI01643.1 multidrug ABC transporter permease [Phytohabitans aurantiacus]
MELLPTAEPGRVRAVVAGLLRARRGLAVAAFGVLVGATAAGLLTAPLLGHVVDLVADGRPPSALTTPVVLLVLIAVVQGVLTAYGVSLVARLGEGMLAELRERFVERALRLPLDRVERAGSGDLTARVTADVSIVAEAVRRALPQLARSGLTIGLTLVGLAVLDWRFFVAALLAVPIQAHTVRWYVGRAIPLYAKQRVAVGAQQQQLLDTVGGAATVRAFRLGDRHVGLVAARSEETVSLALRAIRLMTRFYGRLNVAEYVGLSAVLIVGFLLVRADAVTIGTAAAAALYFHNLFTPINIALALADDAQVAAAGLARLVGVADMPAPPAPRIPAPRPASDTGRPAPPVAHVDGAVKVAGLGHQYVAGHPVLHGVDLDVAPGERVALVGASGAGKSTVAKLVAGVHHPTAGTVTIGGTLVDEFATGRTVALVTQEVHVFAGRLDDDLRLARPSAPDKELRDALAMVGALEWAEALPDGLATVVGEGGHKLTATQAQQLALARLVLADPPVAVLDEATAEAGSAGARVLEEAAARALDGRTALVVAHRLTQAATADRVIVLDAGRVVESGPHKELLTADGPYATLWTAWSATR